MVCDSRVSHGEGRFKTSKKIQKSGKYLAGVSGDYTPALAYLKTFHTAARACGATKPPTLPPYEGEFELMVMSEHGLWLYGEDGTPVEVEDADIYALGSGGSYAMGCLAAQERSMDAYDLHMAIEIACEYDGGSSLPVVELTLKSSRAGSRGHDPLEAA